MEGVKNVKIQSTLIPRGARALRSDHHCEAERLKCPGGVEVVTRRSLRH